MNNRLKELRRALGLSQAELAVKIQKSPGYIANAESGRSTLSDYTIDMICEKFAVNKAWLLSGSGEMFAAGRKDRCDEGSVGTRLRNVRKHLKMTQEDFSKHVGYSRIQVQSVERGKVRPSAEFIHKVAVSCNVSETWLTEGTGCMKDCVLDEGLLDWLRSHPDVVQELKERAKIG